MSHISSFSSLLSFFISLFFSNGQDIGREPHPLSHLLTMFSHLGCFTLCSPFFFPPLSSPFCSPVLILFPIRSLLPPLLLISFLSLSHLVVSAPLHILPPTSLLLTFCLHLFSSSFLLFYLSPLNSLISFPFLFVCFSPPLVSFVLLLIFLSPLHFYFCMTSSCFRSAPLLLLSRLMLLPHLFILSSPFASSSHVVPLSALSPFNSILQAPF